MRSANLQCFSNGESWAGLEYMFWIQRSHGRSAGTKLCNYIAADRLSYQYVCYENFEISGWKEQYAIRKIGQFLFPRVLRSCYMYFDQAILTLI